MPRRPKWGQHWVASDELARALVRHIEPRPGDRILEIGAGRGRLTRALLDHPVELVAVEIDAACCSELRRLQPLGAGRLTVIEADVLGVDPASVGLRPPLRAVGNLPYAIAGPILRWTVEHRRSFHDLHYMLPADVAERVLSPPGSRRYGFLSVLVQWFYRGRVLRRLGPGSFRPPPRIDSAFVRLEPRNPPACMAPAPHLWRVVGASFAHRRKTLRNTLRRAGWSPEQVDAACDAAGVRPEQRAEALPLEAFARLAEALPELPP